MDEVDESLFSSSSFHLFMTPTGQFSFVLSGDRRPCSKVPTLHMHGEFRPQAVALGKDLFKARKQRLVTNVQREYVNLKCSTGLNESSVAAKVGVAKIPGADAIRTHEAEGLGP